MKFISYLRIWQTIFERQRWEKTNKWQDVFF